VTWLPVEKWNEGGEDEEGKIKKRNVADFSLMMMLFPSAIEELRELALEARLDNAFT